MADNSKSINDRFPMRNPAFVRLLDDAEDARLARRSNLDAALTHRARAALLLEQALSGPKAMAVDLQEYVTRIATLLQILEGAISGMTTVIQTESRPTSWLYPFGTALVDVIHFVAASVEADEQVALRLSIGRKRGVLIAGLEVRGAYSPVAPAAATHGLLRAAAIIDGLGGCLERGVNSERMVVGVIFDRIGKRRFLGRCDGTCR